jgi:hypothetical protein
VLDHVRVVLVSPKTVGNVGAAARLCANFECNDLWVVSPRCDTSGDGATPSSLEAPGWGTESTGEHRSTGGENRADAHLSTYGPSFARGDV